MSVNLSVNYTEVYAVVDENTKIKESSTLGSDPTSYAVNSVVNNTNLSVKT